MTAETVAWEIGVVSLAESLALTSLAMQKAPERGRRYAVRWLRRLLEEDPHLPLKEVQVAASAPAALGGPSRSRSTRR